MTAVRAEGDDRVVSIRRGCDHQNLSHNHESCPTPVTSIRATPLKATFARSSSRT